MTFMAWTKKGVPANDLAGGTPRKAESEGPSSENEKEGASEPPAVIYTQFPIRFQPSTRNPTPSTEHLAGLAATGTRCPLPLPGSGPLFAGHLPGGYPCPHERRHPHPHRPRRGRSARRGAASAAGLR